MEHYTEKELLDRRGRMMFYMTTQYAQKRDDAEDIVQEALIIACRNRLKVAKKSPGPLAWLMWIARGVIKNRMRSKKSQIEVLSLDFLETLENGARENIIPSDQNLEDELISADFVAKVTKITERLKPRTRDVFLRRELEGEKYDTIATDHQISQQRCHQIRKDACNRIKTIAPGLADYL